MHRAHWETKAMSDRNKENARKGRGRGRGRGRGVRVLLYFLGSMPMDAGLSEVPCLAVYNDNGRDSVSCFWITFT
ncbi:hypothetical protein VNO78_04216 [Psophocarpus tetragonolobus]|uniref:Uncharacterized protein n=1 Tax=Psophocarpus tetragonolobus TaxID=3891 RepID=A0AAN9T2Q2_PSOTE